LIYRTLDVKNMIPGTTLYVESMKNNAGGMYELIALVGFDGG